MTIHKVSACLKTYKRLITNSKSDSPDNIDSREAYNENVQGK
jgi:hypothetical protein